ncbi:hypothetical protein BDP27DRAFT_449013 [Rhodocollybia butyracea]|uniref:Uncharacterized protein n=1 Tax=Rhodocollybia butyracea TaxID=206335 RepID=A0A9P5TZ10_9AGAR|nr:hypothetical protein BDP27DRAFT_449013 [Rhodocollybia butyracea]
MHSPSGERVRTLSFPSRPDSTSPTSPLHSSRQRYDSREFSQSSSRTSSRASSRGSLSSKGHADLDEERIHEQERNWNSPKQHWGPHSRSNSTDPLHSHSHTPSSALKRTRSLNQKVSTPSPGSSTSSNHFSLETSASARRRAESLKSTKAPPMQFSSPVHVEGRSRHRVSLSSMSPPSSKRPTVPSTRSDSYPARPRSPLPPLPNAQHQLKKESSPLFPSSSLQLQPLSQIIPPPESTNSPSLTHKLPSSDTPYRISNLNSRSSYIPVRSLLKPEPLGAVLAARSPSASLYDDQEVQEKAAQDVNIRPISKIFVEEKDKMQGQEEQDTKSDSTGMFHVSCDMSLAIFSPQILIRRLTTTIKLPKKEHPLYNQMQYSLLTRLVVWKLRRRLSMNPSLVK